MRRLANISGITLGFYFLWKIAMLLFTSQPVPSNDSFFYDGPVVNYLLHGKYCNPALANVLPISGNEVFCAYPPLYQAVLLGWMKCFGASELSAMWLHVGLLALFAAAVWQILRVLKAPALAVNFAGLFLFGITFHDRPDTLAHALAAFAVLAMLRGLPWATAVFLVLTFATSLQIGGIYALWLAGLVLTGNWFAREKIPWAAALSFLAALVGLAALVKFGYPRLWEGFREHVAITPSVTGLRVPTAGDVLKLVRNSPGNLLVIASLAGLMVTGKIASAQLRESVALRLVVSGGLAALALMFGCLLILTPNTIHIGTYLQPVLIGGLLVALTNHNLLRPAMRRVWSVAVGLAVLCVSVRALGISSWGVWCARDVNRADALSLVERELDAVPAGGTVFVSAAYLYQTAARTNLVWLHSDWASLATEGDWELRAIQERQPAKLLLTQFDYYRRYERIVSLFQRSRGDVVVRIDNRARVQSPDAIPATRKVVQHISWAPVVIEFTWPTSPERK